jgi:hypothetical protein
VQSKVSKHNQTPPSIPAAASGSSSTSICSNTWVLHGKCEPAPFLGLEYTLQKAGSSRSLPLEPTNTPSRVARSSRLIMRAPCFKCSSALSRKADPAVDWPPSPAKDESSHHGRHPPRAALHNGTINVHMPRRQKARGSEAASCLLRTVRILSLSGPVLLTPKRYLPHGPLP